MTKKKDKIVEDTPHIAGEPPKATNYIDVSSTDSELKGFAGFVESTFRKHKDFAFISAMVPAMIAYVLCITISAIPGYFIITNALALTETMATYAKAFLIPLSFVISYGIFGISLLLVIPFFNWIMPLKIKPWRGNWYSLQTVPWYYHNALTQLARYAFLDYVTPTPLNLMFYKLMGMKIGKGCVINTSNISDPCLIELEDYVTIGGSATIFGHYAQAGVLILAPVKIKRGATVGLKASIMGDVIVGEKVTVKPHSVLLPKTRLNKGDPQ
jgi:hypothetical protein